MSSKVLDALISNMQNTSPFVSSIHTGASGSPPGPVFMQLYCVPWTITNSFTGTFAVTFSEPFQNQLVAVFSSTAVGQGSTSVPDVVQFYSTISLVSSSKTGATFDISITDVSNPFAPPPSSWVGSDIYASVIAIGF